MNMLSEPEKNIRVYVPLGIHPETRIQGRLWAWEILRETHAPAEDINQKELLLPRNFISRMLHGPHPPRIR